MWFLGSLSVVILLGIFASLLGWSTLQVIYRYKKSLHSAENLAVSALLGTGLLMLLFGYTSYLGVAGRYAGPAITLVSLFFIFIVSRKNPTTRPWRKTHYFLISTGIVSSILVLMPLLFFHAYNPYNDTLTYISIADYLIDHPFSQLADPNPSFPLLTQALLYQKLYFRMGANFFLTFVQSITPVTRAYEIYPAVIAWGLTLNVFAAFLGCRWLLRLPYFFSWLAAFLVAVAINPPHYATTSGFFPQTLGTAFFLFTLALLARTMRTHLKQRAPLIQLALATTFTISAYSEMFPVLLLVFGIVILVHVPRSLNQLKIYLKAGLFFIFLIAVLANLEIYRMALAIPSQLHAIVGWDVGFSQIQFIGTALGFEPQTGFNLHHSLRAINFACIVGFIILFLIGLIQVIKKRTATSVWLTTLIVFIMMYLYFALIAKNPWTHNHGQTWDMFKIVNWAYLVMVIGIAAGLSRFPSKKMWISCALIFFCFTTSIHFSIARDTTTAIREMTFSNTPFAAYAQLTELVAQLSPNSPIELRLSPQAYKHREILAYFFYPHPVISDWREDGYIYPWLKEEYRNIELKTPHIILSDRKPGHTYSYLLPAGVIDSTVQLTYNFGQNWYDAERQITTWWRWSSGKGELYIDVPTAQKVRLRAIWSATTLPLKIQIIVNNKIHSLLLINKPGFNTAKTIIITLKKGKNTIQFNNETPGKHIEGDSRILAFGIKDMEITPL